MIRLLYFLMIIPLLLFATASEESNLQKISLQLQWKHQFEFAGFYAAQEKGYYRDAGLNVSFHEYNHSIDLVKEVLSGNRDFGIWASSLIQERLTGKPVIMLANYFKRSPLVIITRPEIQFPGDLEGKKLMISPKDLYSANFIQMFHAFGIDPNKDIVTIPHSFRIQDFIEGKVDAISGFLTNEPYQLQQERFSYNVLDPNNYGVEQYDSNLFTSESFYQKNPDITAAFTEASQRGWEYALEHPEEIVELIYRRYNTQNKTRDALIFEAREISKIMLPKVYPVGSINENKIKKIAELFVQIGKAKSLDHLPGLLLTKKSTPHSISPVSTDKLKQKAEYLAKAIADPLYNIDEAKTIELLKAAIDDMGIEAITVKEVKFSTNQYHLWREGASIQSSRANTPSYLENWEGLKITTPILLSGYRTPFATITVYTKTEAESPIKLTPEEQAWLQKHPIIKVANETDWPPFDFMENDQPAGYSIEYIQLVAKKVGLEIEFVNGHQWMELIEMFKNGQIDAMPTFYKNSERESYTLFTTPYAKNTLSLYSTTENDRLHSIKDLGKGVVIGMNAGDGFIPYIRKLFPDVTLKEFEGMKNLFRALASNSVDGIVENPFMLHYYKNKYQLFNLQLVDFFDPDSPETSTANHIGVRKDLPILHSILQKSMNALSFQEKEELNQKWLGSLKQQQSTIPLTEKERAWIQTHPVIRVHNELDWPPFNFFENGRAQGISIDIMNHLAEIVGLEVEYVTGPSWNEFMKMLKSQEIDVMLNMMNTEKRREFFDFTTPYYSAITGIYSHKDTPSLGSFADLKGKTVVVPKGFYYHDFLAKNHPEIHLSLKKDVPETLEAVAFKEADATVGQIAVLDYLLAKRMISNVILTGKAASEGLKTHLSIATNRDNSVLHGILQKALDSTSGSDRFNLISSWLNNHKSTPAVPLTQKERAWLQKHPILKVANEMDFPPFDFVLNGQPQGYSIDLLDLLAKKIGFEVEYVNGHDWNELITMFKNGELDLLQSASETSDRQQYALFSDSYIRTKTHFITRKGNPEISSLAELKNKTFAVGRGWRDQGFIAEKYPEIVLAPQKGANEILDAVSRGDAYATDMTIQTAQYLIKKMGLQDLKISGWFKEYDDGQSTGLHFMAQKEAPELITMLNKALASLTPGDLEQLERKWFGTGITTQSSENIRINLAPEEQAYLDKKEIITYCVDPYWQPFEWIDEQGQHNGLTRDYLDIIKERSGIRTKLVKTDSWTATLEALKSRRCDMCLQAAPTESRREYLGFTDMYLHFPQVVATRLDESYINSTADILDKKIGLMRGYAITEILKNRYPTLKITEVDNVSEGVRLVVDGKLDGMIDFLPAISDAIRTIGSGNVKIAGQIEESIPLGIGARNDEPELLSILDKAVQTITPEDRKKILDKWMTVQFEQEMDYALIWKILAGAALLLLGFSWWNRKLSKLNKQIKQAQSETEIAHTQVSQALTQVETLLDNSGQGFLSFSSDLIVDEGYSRECEKIFGETLQGQPIDRLLSPDDEKTRLLIHSGIQKTIEYRDDAIRSEAFMNLVPNEYHLRNRYYRSEYRLLKDEKMMLILTDVTDEKKLKQRVEKEKKRLEFIVNAMENRNDLLETLRDYKRFRQEILPALLSQCDHSEAVITQIYRQVHTFKGLFAQDSLPEIPKHLHELETELGNLKDGGNHYTQQDIKMVFARFDLGAPLEEDLRLIRDKLGDSYFVDEKEVSIPISMVDRLEQEALALLVNEEEHIVIRPENLKLLHSIRRLRHVTLESLLSPHFKAAEQLAGRLEKPIHPIHYKGDTISVDPSLYGAFCKNLVHLFRNAIDHGIEDEDDRFEAEKEEIATITCGAEIIQNQLILTIADDGRGMDSEVIKTTAIKKALITQEEAEGLEHQEILRLIFHDGFSTKKEISTISGRGVGLGALYQALTTIGGQVEIQTEPGKGAIFIFTLPYESDEEQEMETFGSSDLSRNILIPMQKIVEEHFSNTLNMKVEVEKEMIPISEEMMQPYTAQVGYDSLHIDLGISLPEVMLLAMTRAYIPECSEEEADNIKEDIGNELANILFGQATIYYSHLEKNIKMGTPVSVDADSIRTMLENHYIYGLRGWWSDHPFTIYVRERKNSE